MQQYNAINLQTFSRNVPDFVTEKPRFHTFFSTGFFNASKFSSEFFANIMQSC
jgi:hypothetical protein